MVTLLRQHQWPAKSQTSWTCEQRSHQPVLAQQSIYWLNGKPGGIYVDATAGSGGHTALLLQVQGVKVIGLDKDEEAIRYLSQRFAGYENFKAIHGGFEEMIKLLAEIGIHQVDGVLFDLGLSRDQVKDAERGFSFQIDGPLDMRYDRSRGYTAADILNTWKRDQLVALFRNYGEIKHPEKVVQEIMQQRKKVPFSRTGQLSSLICSLVRRRGHRHPATLFFQALRLAVNNELECLSAGLEQARQLLRKSGRIVVISFHSLEDRIVKHFFAGCADFSILTKKPVVPDFNLIKTHPESRSARLRAAEKI